MFVCIQHYTVSILYFEAVYWNFMILEHHVVLLCPCTFQDLCICYKYFKLNLTSSHWIIRKGKWHTLTYTLKIFILDNYRYGLKQGIKYGYNLSQTRRQEWIWLEGNIWEHVLAFLLAPPPKLLFIQSVCQGTQVGVLRVIEWGLGCSH